MGHWFRGWRPGENSRVWLLASQDLHSLLKALAECKVLSKARALGELPSDHEISLTLSQYRRLLSTTAVCVKATCLITRMGHLGAAAKDAALRRNLSVRQEAALREEAKAFYQAHMRGRGAHRTGDIIH